MSSKSFSFANQRMLWTRALIGVLAAYAFVTAPPDWAAGGLAQIGELIGFILLSTAGFGRLWSLLFIGGRKNSALIDYGPYSVVRNPLYVFNFLGAVGFGLVIENPAVALLLTFSFLGLYPAVVKREEARLEKLYGESFRQYCARTPRWLPNFRRYHEPPNIVVSSAGIRKAMLDAAWFLLAFLFWEATEGLRQFGYLTTLF